MNLELEKFDLVMYIQIEDVKRVWNQKIKNSFFKTFLLINTKKYWHIASSQYDIYSSRVEMKSFGFDLVRVL